MSKFLYYSIILLVYISLTVAIPRRTNKPINNKRLLDEYDHEKVAEEHDVLKDKFVALVDASVDYFYQLLYYKANLVGIQERSGNEHNVIEDVIDMFQPVEDLYTEVLDTVSGNDNDRDRDPMRDSENMTNMTNMRPQPEEMEESDSSFLDFLHERSFF